MTTRDMTERQFREACERRGFVTHGIMGYYTLGDTGVQVSVLNAGTTNRRACLAYLIRQHDRIAERS